MEPSTTTKLYQYVPLPKDRALSFRIFTLYPSNQLSDTIQGRIHIISPELSDTGKCICERYEALSYSWGDATPTGVIEFSDKSYLQIATNLESFLRYRRQREETVILWIDMICIDQRNFEERSSQVQAMGQIYSLASCLSIWLGSPSDDSTLAMSALREMSCEHAFSKLSVSTEDSAAIDCLLKRAWWFRAWIIQEIALGGAGTKYDQTTVLCGFECIKWFELVVACSRMYVNNLNMRQRFPAVENVLTLDTLPSRWRADVLGTSELYASRLLRQLSERRSCLASDPRDKIYALLGLWPDAMDVRKQIAMSRRATPTVDYNRSVEDVYVDFATWIIVETQSLVLLHHCQPYFSNSPVVRPLPTWVPDWSQALAQARLPCSKTTERASIPWWSLPERSGAHDKRHIKYRMQDQFFYRKRAKEILRPIKSTLHFIPEWLVDSMDPDGTKGYDSLFKELQGRPDVIFVSPDESDRALGNDGEDLWTALERTQDYNERHLQIQVLSQYIESCPRLCKQYRACADTMCKVSIKERRLCVEGILVDTVREVYEAFPEEIDRDWTNSTLLMVQIGTYKEAVIGTGIEAAPYFTKAARLMAFWRTLFAGQQISDETAIASWLPRIPLDWQWTVPSLTVLESARLEFAEIGIMTEAFTQHLASLTSNEGTFVHSAFDDYLAKDDILLDARWTSSDRSEYSRTFEASGKEWAKQPYDLYHRPFNLPYVVPDPFWESRVLHDEAALKASIDSRHRTIFESLNAESREVRREVRRFMAERIRQQPAREPTCTEDVSLIKYALGRRFFVSEDGYFGLAPPDAQKGDRVAVLYGVNVPLILREYGRAFQIVGESYVHGLMNGEAVDKWRLGLKEVRNIIIV